MPDIICYFLIDEDGLIIQKSYPYVEGWIEGPDYVAPGYFYINGEFVPPPPYVPTPEEVLATNTALLNKLTKQANAQVTAIQGRIDTINDAIDLDEALPSEIAELPVVTALLKKWKSYRILLGRVTLQAGWPPEPVWPVVPELYITTTDSNSSEAKSESSTA